MSLPLSGQTPQISCKDCCFAIYQDKTQIGCEFDRVSKYKNIDKLIEAYDFEKEFYVIDGFCNLYRTEKWNCGIKDKDKALSESSQSFDVFIHCDNIATFKNKIINFITNNTYDIKKYDIFLCCNKNNINSINEAVGIYANTNIKDNIFVSTCSDINLHKHKIITKSNRSFFIVLDEHSTFDPDILSNINNLINIDMTRFIVMNHKNDIIISNTAYRFYALSENEKENINYTTMIDKLFGLSKKENMYIEI
jgi:hypothetical protein